MTNSISSTTKRCRKCKEEKPIETFKKNKIYRDGHTTICKICYNAIEQARRPKRPNKLASTHVRSRKPGYGLTVKQYDQMLAEQGGVCAACGNAESKIDDRTHRPRKLAVDHDHSTGLVRGLLCGSCNVTLGYLKDDAKRIEALLAYLIRHTAQ